ncbi:TetR/AcrR family transcriptional regulator [Pandoraea sp.]|uniref:TetR/AcrR family transcriptional regulator n=1 Tax=Pandoraea sp. TaxID=1883445 RepID=UPI0011F47E1A|nr:TetR/AcrR family transcriptional regulator [Pandoraea sp.]TAL55279.1 MAG: TetR/AcrR family transcriptional regulator [Pandoraea sp.]TAM18197.1 MAG: TetR/AcrR family transcriptional regulator [Pandoraea sp.]
MNKTTSSAPQLRGPSDHDVRTQIVEAATEHFSHFGYEKTTVSDLAKAIGFSKAYIYKFFDSKQAIGEVICSNCLSEVMKAVDEAVSAAPTASERLRQTFRALVEAGSNLFFQERKLFDIAAAAASGPWSSARAHEDHVRQLIARIILEGRHSGEFERKTPLDEITNAIYLVMRPYVNPLLLQYNLDLATDATAQLSGLILRSLAP